MTGIARCTICAAAAACVITLEAASPNIPAFAPHPAVGWTSFAVAFWVWHTPWLYELALRSDAWHHVEHACLFTTAMMFWRPVILTWPARSPWPRWTMIPYLLLADLQNTVLAAILTLSDRVIYPAYAVRLGAIAALEDQSVAGVIMWVPGSLVFLVAAVWVAVEILAPPGRATLPAPPVEGEHLAGSHPGMR